MRFTKRKVNIILLLCSVLFAVLMSELVLRIVLPAPIVWKYPQEKYAYDPEIGHRLIRDQRAFTHDKPVRINSVGIRDSDYQSEASPGAYRILALGDSQTFGNGLGLVDTWPKQLETMLNKDGKLHAEVINGGIPGTDTWQHEIILQRLVSAYSTDAIILAFYVNDVVKSFTPAHVHEHRKNSLMVRAGYLMRRSALLLTLHSAIKKIRQTRTPSWQYLQQNMLLMGESNPDIEGRWSQVERSLAEMKKISNANKIDLMILAIPRRDQVDGRMPWKGYYARLESIANRCDIPIFSTLEPLQEAYQQYGKSLFIPWDGHNTRIANMVIANEAADTVLLSR